MNSRFNAVRLLVYAVSFVGLMVFLFAVHALASLLLSQVLPETRSLVSGSSVREQVSYYLAALIVATPLWLFFWRLARRRVERDPAELESPERHLFLSLTGAIGAIIALFALHTVLRVIFTLPAEHQTRQILQDLAPSVIRLIVYGLAFVVAIRIGLRESHLKARAHDLALFVVSGFALAFLAIGALDAISVIVAEITGTHGALLLGASTTSLTRIWGHAAAWILSGGSVWAAATAFDRSGNAPRDFRLPYIYLVLAVSVAMTVISGTDMLYEILRRVFGYSTPNTWHFLQNTLPWLVVGGVLWIYHWIVLRAQREELAMQASIPPKRRLGVAGYSFIGLAMAAPGAAVLVWLILDFLFGTHRTFVAGGAWWTDRLSAGLAIVAVGLMLWVPSWLLLQRSRTDAETRSSAERRWLLAGVSLIAALAAVGFTIAFLWTLLQAVLGGGLDTKAASKLFKYLGTALIALAVVAYYGAGLRSDLRLAPARRRARLTVLVEPGGEALLDELRRSETRRIQVAGYLTGQIQGPRLTLAALHERLAAAQTDHVLVALGPDGSVMYPYTQQPEGRIEMPQSAALPAPGS